MKPIIVAFTLLSCLLATGLFSQTKDDLALGAGLIKVESLPEYHFSYQGSNELENLSQLLFVFYKKFISSQDLQMCNFQPSCSVYAKEVIEQRGFLLGSMATFDRMSRCHPLAHGHYPLHNESGLLYDPVPEAP